MFRQSPLEELEERLAQLRAALNEKDWLETRLREAAEQRARLEAEIEAARERVAREARDVERFEAGGVVTRLYELLNLTESKLEKERQELAVATLRVESARQELELLHEERVVLDARLAKLAGVYEAYQKAIAEKLDWLAVAGDPGAPSAAKALEQAEGTGQMREWLREIDEAIDYGQRADATLRAMAEQLEGLASGWARLGSSAAGNEPQRELLWYTTRARHRIIVFYEEVAQVRRRVEGSTRTLPGMDLEQLLVFFDDFTSLWLGNAVQPVAVDIVVAGLRANIGDRIGQLQAFRRELSLPRSAADDVLRSLDRLHDR